MSVTQVPIELSSTPGIVDNSNATAITIDSSENVLVGKTSLAIANEGIVFEKGGAAEFTRDAARVMRLNRTSDDGSIVEFNKDGTIVGSINNFSSTEFGLVSEKNLVLTQNTTTERNLVFSSSYFGSFGADDATIDLGRSVGRFKDLYLSGGAYLGGTAAANKLDDYEEGTFTVTVNGSSGGNNTAYYTKIGNTVFWQYYTGAKTFTAVQAKITGLPFTTSNASENYAAFFGTHNTATTNATGGYSSLNSTVAYFVVDNSISSTTYNAGTKYFMVSGKYTVD